jgi:phage-related protein
MADYNLGRARGRIEITSDTRGADDARRAMDRTSESAGRLNESTRQLSETEQRRNSLQSEYTAAADRRRRAEQEYRRVIGDQNSTLEDQSRAERDRNRARGEALQLSRQLSLAERALRADIDGNSDSVRRLTDRMRGLNDGHRDSRTHWRQFRTDLTETDRMVRALASSVSGLLGPALKSLAVAGAIGAGSGILGLLGGGALQVMTVAVVGLVEAIKDLSGALIALPAVAGGAVAVMGVLAVSFRGVSDALGAAMANDPRKFAEAIKEMGPATRSVVTQLASFTSSFKGAMQAVQESFMTPLVDAIAPLVRTWLPALMNAGQQLGGVMGNLARSMLEWLQQPQVMATFQSFINNLSQSLQALQPAFTAFSDAMLTLTRVGAEVFPTIADAIVRAANAFNEWIQGAAQSGQLQAWLERSIEAFGDLFSIVKDVGIALNNISNIQGGDSFLGWLSDMAQKFREWTESASGASSIASFFNTLSRAGEVAMPVFKIIAGAIGDLFTLLIDMGQSMGTGITDFFQSLREALVGFGEALVASGPAIGEILATVGQAFKEIVTAGDFPKLFRSIADAVKTLAPAFVAVSNAVIEFLSSLSPQQIQVILGIVVALKGFQVLGPIIMTVVGAVKLLGAAFTLLAANPVVLLIAAIAALVAGVIIAYNTNEDFRNAVNDLWDDLKSFASWVGSTLVNVWDGFVGAIKKALEAVGNFGTEVKNAISNGISNLFTGGIDIFTRAYEWGRSIVDRMIDGIKSMFQPLSDAWDWLVGRGIDDKNPKSPPKTGPLSGAGDPLRAGENITGRLAAGIESGGDAVSSAYDSVLSGPASSGTGGQGFSSAGGSYRTGSSRERSGLNEWIHGLTKDLSAWASIARNAFAIFENVANIVLDTTRIVANLWNGGDNPLTRPGGLFGQPATPPQADVPGVQQIQPAPGVAPDQYGRDLAGQSQGSPVAEQQAVPGVPQVQPNGSVTPPQGGGSKPIAAGTPTVPLKQNPDGTWTSTDPEWAKLIARESGGRNIGQQITDVNGGPGSPNAAQGIFQITPETWRGNGGEEFAPNPLDATPEQQAIVAARIFNARGGQPWGSGKGQNFGREDEDKLRAGLINTPITVPQAPPPGPPAGSAKYPPGTVAVTAGGTPIIGPIDQLPPGAKRVLDAEAFGGINFADDQQPTSGAPAPGLFGGAGSAPSGSRPAPNAPLVGGGGAINVPRPPAPPSGTAPQPQAGPLPYTSNPESQAGDFGGNKTTYSRQFAEQNFKNRLFNPAEAVSGTSAGLPPWLVDLAKSFNLNAVTRPSGDSLHQAGFATDIFGNQEDMTKMAEYIQANLMDQTIQLIYRDAKTQRTFGIAGGQAAGPGTDAPGYYSGAWAGHEDHLHWATDVAPLSAGPNAGVPAPPQGLPLFGRGGDPTKMEKDLLNDIKANPGKYPLIGSAGKSSDYEQQLLQDIRNNPGKYPLIGPAGSTGAPPVRIPDQPHAGSGISPGELNAPGAMPAGQAPIDTVTSALGAAGSIAGDVFRIVDDVINNINATADLTDTFVRGFENTEDVMKTIDQIQTFIKTASDVAGLTKNVLGLAGGIVGAAAAADPSGGAGAAGGGLMAASAIAGVVQSGIETTNAAIDLGQEVYRIISKYGAVFAGFMLGGPETGPLGGDVRMLLNTRTNEIYAYSQQNPDLKETHSLPDWMARSYGGVRPGEPQLPPQLNLYVGPGSDPKRLISDTMWLVNSSPAVTSVAGSD